MPNPKRKLSKIRKRTRRAHHALEAKNLTECPRCASNKLPHRVCGNCGFYKDSYVVKL